MEAVKITPEYVKTLEKPTERFFCPLSANRYKIQFLQFRVRDLESKDVLFEMKRDPEDFFDSDDEIDEDQIRTAHFHFGPWFFMLKSIGTSIVFSVGDKPVKNLRLIERHYFKDKLIRSFDFNFGFCIPNSTNEWESIYEMPPLEKKVVDDMVNSPWKTTSDSFFFVDDELIIHNKAKYSYALEEDSDES